MTAEQLMDSIKVRSELEAFASAWSKRKTTEAEKLVRLEALLDVLMPTARQTAPIASPPRLKSIEAQPESIGRDFTPDEAAEARAEDERNKPMPHGQLMDWAFDKYCKGKRRSNGAGGSSITMPIQDKETGRMLPMQGWEEYFKSHGIGVSSMETVMDVANGRFTLMWG